MSPPHLHTPRSAPLAVYSLIWRITQPPQDLASPTTLALRLRGPITNVSGESWADGQFVNRFIAFSPGVIIIAMPTECHLQCLHFMPAWKSGLVATVPTCTPMDYSPPHSPFTSALLSPVDFSGHCYLPNQDLLHACRGFA